MRNELPSALQVLLAGHQTLFRLRDDRDAGDGDAQEEVRRRGQNAFGIQVGASHQSWYRLKTFAEVFTARFRRTRGLAVTFCRHHHQTLTLLVPP